MQNKNKKMQTSKSAWIETPKENICPVCGKKYEYMLKVSYLPDGSRICEHDYGGAVLYFTEREKKMAEKLHKEGKYLVKGSDGFTRICEPLRDKNGRIIERKRKFF
jgi:hypothetical protein